MTLTLPEQADDFTQLNYLNDLELTLGLMVKNLFLNNFDPTAKIVTVSNTNLYKVAEKYYNDSTLWTVIAKANGLIDPEIATTRTLIIPSSTKNNDTGGILT